MKHEYCAFIGRFEPLHNQHLQVIKYGLTVAKELIICVGSAYSARNIKNPFTYAERVEMIQSTLSPYELTKVHFVPVRDYFNDDTQWLIELQQKISNIAGDKSVCLTGTYKDSSSYYIKLFPNWEFFPSPSKGTLNATDIRNAMFGCQAFSETSEEGKYIKGQVPLDVFCFLHNFQSTPFHKNLVEEHKYIQEYKERSKFVGHPWSASFNTADAMVTQSGHVLLVKRGNNPGKGLWALPGGFLDNDTCRRAAIRELREETKIKIDPETLDRYIVDEKLCDHPNRSLRGRVISMAYHIKLPAARALVEVKAASDAKEVKWVPFMDISKMEEEFFEDHYHIVQYFLRKSND